MSDFLKALAFSLLLLGAALWADRAHAQSVTYSWSSSACPDLHGSGYTSFAAACTAAGQAGVTCGNRLNPTRSYSLTGTSTSGGTCTYSFHESVTNSDGSAQFPISSDANQCAQYAGKTAQTTFTWGSDGDITSTKTMCVSNVNPGASPSGCELTAQPSQCYTAPNGTMQCQGTGQYSGANCDPATYTGAKTTDQPKVDPQDVTTQPCSGYFAPVNGVDTCVPSPATNTIEHTTATTTQTPASGPASTTQDQTTTTTTCDPTTQVCTTTTNTTTCDPATQQCTTKSTSTTQTKAGYCAANPTSKACFGDGTGSGSTFSGSCTTDFQCSGDAALCAAAKATNQIHCDLQVDTNQQELKDYEAAKAAQASEIAAGRGGTGLPTETLDVGPTTFDQSDALGGTAACLQDRQLQVSFMTQSRTLVIPFSRTCSVLDVLRYVLLAMTALFCASIVYGAVKG